MNDMQTAIILNFHAIGIPLDNLEQEDRACSISRDFFLTLLDEINGRKDVILTFDDGFISDIELALPALAERSLSASFFPIANRLERHGFVGADGIQALSA